MLTLYTTSSVDDPSIEDRFTRLCERLLAKNAEDVADRDVDPLNVSRFRTIRLRIVTPGAASARALDHSGHLRSLEDAW